MTDDSAGDTRRPPDSRPPEGGDDPGASDGAGGRGAHIDGLPLALLRRHLSGAADAGERERVERWAAVSASRRDYLAALTRTWARAHWGASAAEREDADAAWRALGVRLDELARDRRRAPRRRAWPRSWEPRRAVLASLAAGLVLAVGVGGSTVLWRRARRTTDRPAMALMREVSTERGQRARLQLGDGSTVVLGVQSRLRFPADFGVRARELELEGEAYFSVAHDSTRPFVVNAAGSRTTDLGTAFVLRAYPSEPRVLVVVTHGQVALGSRAPGAPAGRILAPGQAGRLAKGELVPTVDAVDTTAYLGFLTGRLDFDNAPLSEVVAELGRWQAVPIRLADSTLARQTVTASFGAESMDEALGTLTTVLRLRASRRNGSVTLYRRER